MLCWNVFIGDFNRRKIEIYNVFNHYNFYEDCIKNIKKYDSDKESFKKELNKSIHYYFWCKCEWEIILSSWPPMPENRFKSEKIDVCDQLLLNWDIFVDYIWENKKELK